MKQVMILAILFAAVFALLTSCSQQKGIDQILQNPEMTKYLMAKMIEDSTIKAEITNQLLADTAWVSMIMDRLTGQMSNRELLMNKLLEHEGMGEIMLAKLAEDEQLRNKMKEIVKR